MIDRKVADIPPFGLRMQTDLKRKLEAAARANNRSLNSEIVARLEQSISGTNRPSKFADVWTLQQRLENLELGIIRILANEQAMEERLALIEFPANKQSA
jgi:hypothetical protein